VNTQSSHSNRPAEAVARPSPRPAVGHFHGTRCSSRWSGAVDSANKAASDQAEYRQTVQRRGSVRNILRAWVQGPHPEMNHSGRLPGPGANASNHRRPFLAYSRGNTSRAATAESTTEQAALARRWYATHTKACVSKGYQSQSAARYLAGFSAQANA